MHKGIIPELLADAAYQHGSVPVVSGHQTFTYHQLYERVVRLANRLVRLGMTPGTVVGVLDVNSHRHFELKYALSLIGAVIHPLNFRLPPDDLLFTVRHAHDEWVFLGDGFGAIAESVSRLVPRTVWWGNGDSHPGGFEYETLIEEGHLAIPDVAKRVMPTDTYSIFYTTGTTGRPKGIRYTHQQMLMGSLQIAHHLALHDTGAKLSADDVLMPLIPFFHIHGWGVPFIGPYLGAALVLPERGGPPEQWDLIKRHRVTWSNMVPTQLFMLLDERAHHQTDPLGLKVLTGGSPLSLGLARRAQQAGLTFSVIYGGSDQLGSAISTIAADVPDAQRLERLMSRLTPFPMVRIEVRAESGDVLPADGKSLGEIWVQSPWLPEGYWDHPEASAAAYHDGWFRTGDLGVRHPDGSISVMDRITDAIKSGGEWIVGSQVESILSEVPGVKAVAVIATWDAKWGQRPLAVVEAHSEVTEALLRQALNKAVDQGRLAKYWVPDRIQFIETMPMTSAGKINKVVLRNLATSESS